ncbi:DUF2840 domain-containing protein [Paracoccus sp. P2]|uniref:DUF2840 domain-containing protein n=1 Tax=Paracoccus sp. P2 TaxID=3248840 RepID=UPI00391FA70C
MITIDAHLADLTRVDLTWIEGRTEYWIRFGQEAGSQILDNNRRHVFFRPGTIFAFVRWAANDFGTIMSRLHILRGVAPGEPCQTLPCVCPGGEILLKIDGWPKVESVLRHIDGIEAGGIDLAEVDPDHWWHVGHWMSAGEAPRPYTAARHRAWLRRREISP